jgi:alkylation response protein AidB-like acyl-CoA dehydrogenase
MNSSGGNGNGHLNAGKPPTPHLARALLANWRADQPDNFFARDVNLQRALEFYWGAELYRKHVFSLNAAGKEMATTVDRLVTVSAEEANLPRLVRYNAQGERVETIVFHPDHHEAGRQIYGTGMMSCYGSPGNNLLSLSLFYLSAQNGEAGHNCAVACTAGLLKAIRDIGTDELRRRYLPGLMDPDYESCYKGAQFLTEVQGGSDVGANDLRARRLDAGSGTWLLNGEKWFCSNAAADLTLVTARIPGQGAGTQGLGLFIVPRVLDDGRLNGVYIQRLKQKLGTRSLDTAEVHFEDAVAFALGPMQAGFKNAMTYVINTSRVYNAMAAAGSARRAYVTASTFAQHRTAFGRSIIHFPLVQDQLANMRVTGAAILAGTMRVLWTMDALELGEGKEGASGFLRLTVNLNKYRSAVLAHGVVAQAIELLGGNGTVEDFSILPRLMRDALVYESWEGTPNVLLAQAQRDIRRYGLDEAFFGEVMVASESIADQEFREDLRGHLAGIEAELKEVLAMDELTAAIFFRPLMDRLTDLYYAACLAAEGEWARREKGSRTKLQMARLFFDRQVAGRQPKDIAYYDDLVSRLCR